MFSRNIKLPFFLFHLQTFGVITMRQDIHGKDGLMPVRPSASTVCSSTSASSSVGALGQRPAASASGGGAGGEGETLYS